MRISYWSSDVCSSDLFVALDRLHRFASTVPQRRADEGGTIARRPSAVQFGVGLGRLCCGGHRTREERGTEQAQQITADRRTPAAGPFWRDPTRRGEIGRASCRGKVCQYV